MSCVLVTTALYADDVYLRDGSFLVGRIKGISNEILTIDTAFAENLRIEYQSIEGISTEQKRMVEIKSGDRVAGILKYSKEKGQKLIKTIFGDIDIDDDTAVVSLWAPDQQSGNVAESATHQRQIDTLKSKHQEEIATVQESYRSKIEELRNEKSRLEDPWSGKILVGVSGKQGNTDSFNIAGRGEAVRDTGFDRLNLYVEGNLEQQNNITSTNEVLAGASLEHDLGERWFVFGSADFEKDEFENLDLRGVAKAGFGYFFIRELNWFFKGLAGLGYQHESFTDGTTLEEGVVSLGYDFEYKHDDWWKIGHKLTYFPSLTSPASDYRIVSNLFTELPLVRRDTPWKLRFSVRNDYDNEPRPGINKLDTSYLMNVVYDFE